MDMDESILLFCSILLIFILKLFKPANRPKNFPPGPPGIPILGNALSLGPLGYKITNKMSEIYGNVIGLQMGSYRVVVLTNFEDIKEALNKKEFSGRFGFNSLLDENFNYDDANMGVIFSSGKKWTELRRFSLKTLRDHGFGKRSMEMIIQEECAELILLLKKHVGRPITTQNRFNVSVLNVVWSIISGSRYDLEDPKLEELNSLLTETIMGALKGVRFLNFLFPPFVQFRKKFPSFFYNGLEFRDKLFQLLSKTIEKHVETHRKGEPRDFIDTYIDHALDAPKGDPNFKLDDNYFSLSVLLTDFFAAGSETTSTLITWALFLLALHPDKQQKLYQEMEEVVGDETVKLTNRPELPYVEAVTSEILRVSALVPMGAPHSTTQDVNFKGFDIPKDTLIFTNIHAVHFDEETWGDPHVFRPERFLSDDGATFVRSNRVITFSVGRRQCMGESLARDSFFVFFTNLVKNFEIKFPKDEPPHKMEGVAGLMLSPESHRIVLLTRSLEGSTA